MRIDCLCFLYFVSLANFCVKLSGQEITSKTLHTKMDSMQAVYGFKELNDSLACQVFIDSLMTSGNRSTNQRSFDLAIKYLEIGEYAARYYIGENTIAHARILYTFGFSYARNNAFAKAEPYLERALKIYENHYGFKCEKCAKTLNTLGFVYHFQSKYDKVEACLEKSVSIYEKLYGKYQSDYINSLNSLCIFLRENGQYEKALQKFPELLELNEKLYTKRNNNYIAALINYSNLLIDLDQFDKAEELRIEALQLSESLNSKLNTTYAQALFVMAAFYRSIGQTNKAENHLVETKKIYEHLNLINLPEYARVLNNLGNLYLSLDKYDIAEKYLLDSKSIIENVLGKKHFEYAQSIENLGVLKIRLGLLKEAEQLISEALQIKLESRGKNEDYTNTLMRLADLFLQIKKPEEAQLALEESLHIRQQLFGNQHKSVAESLKVLSNIYEIKANYSLADSCRLAYFKLVQTIFRKAMSYMSASELKQYTQNYISELDHSIQLYFQRKNESGLLSEICYNNALFYKGFLLNELLSQKNSIITNPDLQEKYTLMLTYSRQLAKQYTKPLHEQNNVAELEEKIQGLEKELSRKVSGFGHSLQFYTWQDVRLSLKNGEAAIEFVHYNMEKGKDSIQYAALVLTSQSPSPSIIPLCSEKQLAEVYTRLQQQNLHSSIAYSFTESLEFEIKSDLYELIWKPLQTNLSGLHRIYFSPSGLLHRISLAAIPVSQGVYVMDQYKLVPLNSTRQLIHDSMENKKSWNNQAILLGGINYELQNEKKIRTSNNSTLIASATRSLSFEKQDSTYEISSWAYLPASFKEVKKLSGLLHIAKFETKLYTSSEATESSCKKYDLNLASPRILHFATHGFFYPDQKNNRSEPINSTPVFQQSKDPMVRSGLILANANFAWKNGYIHESLDDDGVLTSLEISQLNLSNTELAVLSACETGLGDITDYEGVFGLQRAFKIAGVKNILMSLWQVPDKETAELMISFYRFWLIDKKSKHDALYLAQSEMRKKGMKPFYWAGFVLVE